jgi:hypothetical protein
MDICQEGILRISFGLPSLLTNYLPGSCISPCRKLAYVKRSESQIAARNGESVASPLQVPIAARIEKNGFIADIRVSTQDSSHIFHYVIQRAGAPEIVHWGQELSLQRAIECVEEFIASHQAKQA